MSARFRIRTSSGQEISFASPGVFGEFVRSGDLAPDDVVYDAETKEWSSALTHPVVLQIQMEAEEESAAAGPSSSPAPEGPPLDEPRESLTMGDIGLDLALAPSQLTPDQEAAAFVAKMEAERAADLDLGEEARLQGLTMEQGGVGVGGQPVEPVAPRRVEPRPAHAEREPPVYAPEPRYEPRTREAPPARSAPPRRTKVGSGAARRYAPFVIIVLVLGAVAVYFGPELLRSEARTGDGPAPDSATGSDEPPATIADNEDAVRRRAEERFLTTTQSALQGLDAIPDVWLRGQYLAAPSDYPNVRSVWDEYLTTIREVRAGDDQRYEAAYVRALDDARVTGSARTLRLAGALTDFRGAAAARARHYDRVEALATAALQGHDALVQAEGTILYTPASGPAVSADPVIEAAGRGPQPQALLERVLDKILAQLQESGGPGTSANVRDWVWTGLLDAVTSP